MTIDENVTMATREKLIVQQL